MAPSSDFGYPLAPFGFPKGEKAHMLYLLIAIYVIVCVFLILVVLLQQGKGADIASAFGASSSQTAFGARGAATLLEKITTWGFVAFSVLAVTISIVETRRSKRTVLAGAPAASKPAPAKAAPPLAGTAAPALPATASAPATAPAVAPPPATSAPAAAAPAPATK